MKVLGSLAMKLQTNFTISNIDSYPFPVKTWLGNSILKSSNYSSDPITDSTNGT